MALDWGCQVKPVSSTAMKILKNPRHSYLAASSLLALGAGVLGYAPLRALLIGAGTVAAAVDAAAAEPGAVGPDAGAPVAAAEPAAPDSAPGR